MGGKGFGLPFSAVIVGIAGLLILVQSAILAPFIHALFDDEHSRTVGVLPRLGRVPGV